MCFLTMMRHTLRFTRRCFSDLCIYDTVELLENKHSFVKKKVSYHTNIMIQTLTLIFEKTIINIL